MRLLIKRRKNQLRFDTNVHSCHCDSIPPRTIRCLQLSFLSLSCLFSCFSIHLLDDFSDHRLSESDLIFLPTTYAALLSSHFTAIMGYQHGSQRTPLYQRQAPRGTKVMFSLVIFVFLRFCSCLSFTSLVDRV
ncbi:hypothetical protein K491DRAFT_448370 [Lophiostoma macrostomum CBS 122681]|uniref:Uncharacterized protein n=1 Tax=Lophiostoma macrostomum CBS 122681 TaxID=1314788 RepID=A0A6A6TQ35_9PLEO|nr:hypothetical protein K491DRAFT_448370 [Lophiostoma macrostomum CBS 122681]